MTKKYFLPIIAAVGLISHSAMAAELFENDSAVAELNGPTPAIDAPSTHEAVEINGEEANVEVIHERYPNRSVKIERHVTQDTLGNYINHGPWTHWDEKGNLVAQGQYYMGYRTGNWMRWYGAEEGKLFLESGAKGFERPIGSEATFEEGQLNGTLKVFDVKKRLICEWQFEDGVRTGRSIWYLPTGAVWQEVNFRAGQLDGELLRLGKENKLAVAERYIDGQRHAIEVEKYPDGKKKSEGWMLYPRTYTDATYDWWTGSAKTVAGPKDAKAQRHGHWVRWYPNGQIQFDGSFKYDAPIGKVTWWHSNGQMQLAGQFEEGEETGKFVWWHPMGQKAVEGEFAAGVPSGTWTRWTVEGKIIPADEYQAQQEEGGLKSEEKKHPSTADSQFGITPKKPANSARR